MTAQDKADFREAVRLGIEDGVTNAIPAAIAQAIPPAVAAAVANHEHCRFDAQEAQRMHQIAQAFSPNEMAILARFGRGLNTAVDKVAVLLVIGVIGLLLWGLVMLSKAGLLKL